MAVLVSVVVVVVVVVVVYDVVLGAIPPTSFVDFSNIKREFVTAVVTNLLLAYIVVKSLQS